MRSQSGGWADGEAEERPVEGRRPWRRAVVARRAASKRLFVWPSPQWKSLFVWPSRQYEKPLRMALSNQTFSNFELQRKGREPFFFRPAGARDRVCHPPACPPTPQQRAKRSYHAMFSAARPDLRVALWTQKAFFTELWTRKAFSSRSCGATLRSGLAPTYVPRT